MKKIIAMLLAVIMLVALCACGAENEPQDTAANTDTAVDTTEAPADDPAAALISDAFIDPLTDWAT